MSAELPVCCRCGRPVTRDEVAVTKKLVNRGATSFLCVPCLARRFEVTEADIRERIAYFRSTGCTLFAPGEEIFQTMLAAPERKAKVENALKQCGGGEARFEPLSQGAPADPDADKREEKQLSGLIDMFGRDKVQIDE